MRFSTEWAQPWVGALLDRLHKILHFNRVFVNRSRYDQLLSDVTVLECELYKERALNDTYKAAIDELEQDVRASDRYDVPPVLARGNYSFERNAYDPLPERLRIDIYPLQQDYEFDYDRLPAALSEYTKIIIREKVAEAWAKQGREICEEIFARIQTDHEERPVMVANEQWWIPSEPMIWGNRTLSVTTNNIA